MYLHIKKNNTYKEIHDHKVHLKDCTFTYKDDMNKRCARAIRYTGRADSERASDCGGRGWAGREGAKEGRVPSSLLLFASLLFASLLLFAKGRE